jgi:outer membrane protein OmpA-like peptidoglycan-associated protein
VRTNFVRVGIFIGLICGLSGIAGAQGFQVERYEPTPAGTWFHMVNHPWYSSTRWFAGGFTLDYAHDPLVLTSPQGSTDIIEHGLVGHFDLAGSFLDRVQLNFSLPVTFYEGGHSVDGISPLSGAAVGDPRVGLFVRLWGQSDRDAVSIHLGGYLWIPIGADKKHAGDSNVRGVPQIILAGLGVGHLRWAVNTGFLIREGAHIGMTPNSVGTEWQLGVALGYADTARHLNVGPEATFSTVIVDGKAFKQGSSSLELLIGANYNIAKLIQIGLGVGMGILQEPGTPDARVLFRIAYAPIKETGPAKPADRDGDGILDKDDACPDQAGPAETQGCPDRDHDGVADAKDQCPDQPAGPHPDPKKPGCPLTVTDRDGDGVPDSEDQCPDQPAGDHPDPLKKGCPFHDKDNDGVPDEEDLCPDVPAGDHPDPNKAGCPLKDTDGDGIMDDVDACPDRAGPADPDPKKNGCPKVTIKSGSTTVLQPVHFARNKDTILQTSFPMLQEVAKTLLANQQIKRVSIEGHADDTGTHEWNQRLSEKRARSTMQFLIKKGVKARRLEYHGFGDTKPLSDDRTEEARAANRRVEFRILKQD